MIYYLLSVVDILKRRWLLSTSYKGIGILYFMFGAFLSAIGATLSLTIRAGLAFTDTQPLAGDNQLYDTIVIRRALIMIFFTVMPILIGGFKTFFVPVFISSFFSARLGINNLSFWLLPHALTLLLDFLFNSFLSNFKIISSFVMRCLNFFFKKKIE